MRWLTAIVFALFYTFIIACIESLLHKPDVEWLNLICKPSFMPSAQSFDVMETITYLMTAVVMARAAVVKKFVPVMPVIAVTDVLWMFGSAAFFIVGSIWLSVVILALVIAVAVGLECYLIGRTLTTAVCYLPVLCWYGFIFCVCLNLFLHN